MKEKIALSFLVYTTNSMKMRPLLMPEPEFDLVIPSPSHYATVPPVIIRLRERERERERKEKRIRLSIS